MKIKKETKSALVVILIVIAVIFLIFKFHSGSDGFKVDTFLLKSVIKQGEKIAHELQITNTKSIEQNFQISVEEISGLVSLSENNFKLDSGEKKSVEVTFEDENLDYEPGVYVGGIVVKADSAEKKVPVIFEIQSQRILFATNLDVSPTYKEIAPGGKSITEIRFFNLNDSKLHNVETTYLIKNFDGDTFVSEVENVIVGSESTISKTIVLPKDIPLGDYAFIAIVKSGGFTSTSSYLFNVNEKKAAFFDEKIFFFENELPIVLIFIFLFVIVILVIYMIHERNKLFLQLRRQQGAELTGSLRNIEKKKKSYLSKTDNPGKKKRIIKRFKNIRKRTIRTIKRKHKKQRRIFKRLRKQKKKTLMRRKLDEWRNQGYNVGGFTTNIRKKDVKSRIQTLKKGGYDTGVLKKRK